MAIREYWLQDPEARPTAVEVSHILEKFLTQPEVDNIIDNNNNNNSTPESSIPTNPFSICSSNIQNINSSQYTLHCSDQQSIVSSSESCYMVLEFYQSRSLYLIMHRSQQLPQDNSASVQQSLETALHASALYSRIENVKHTLKLTQYKQFQLQAIEALQLGKDVIVVQPTGAGKSVCYIVPK